MTDLVEAVALALLNDDRIAGGWPPVTSRDNIENSDGYVRNARAVIPVELGHLREPTPAMLDAFVSRALQVSIEGEGGWSAYGRNQWQAMLDAAIRGLGEP